MHRDGFYFISFIVTNPDPTFENAVIRCHPLKWLMAKREESVAEYQRAKEAAKASSGPPPFMRRWVVLSWEEISEDYYDEMAKQEAILKL